jgi:putative metallohydrolase (TIGR04338 family)
MAIQSSKGVINMTERDQQRSRVYVAEQAALKANGRTFATVKEIERYLTMHLKRKTLTKRYGRTVDLKAWPINMVERRGHSAAAYGTYKIEFGNKSLFDWVALHEVAHVIHDRLGYRNSGTHGATHHGGAAHGWQFCAIYLDLVTFCMGRDAARKLKASFKAKRVKFTKPRVRKPMTAEQRAAMIERMEHMRSRRVLNLVEAA